MISKRSKPIWFTAFCAILIGAGIIYAWGYCYRSFIFMGKTTRAEGTMAFMEVRYGECEAHRIYYLQLGDVPPAKVDHGRSIDQPVLPVWEKEFVRGDTLEWVQQFERFGDHFVIKYFEEYTIDPPPHDSAFPPPGEDWTELERKGVIDLEREFDQPLFNVPVQLYYRHPGGLYKNYQISEAYKVGDYFFIVTQPSLAGAYTNCAGVLVYRIVG